jgi:cytochrome c
MKKAYFVLAALAFAILSCGQKEKKTTEDYSIPAEESTATQAVDPIAQGEALVKANDCKTCHHKTNKIIGPAHLEVARKYEFTAANVKMLAGKIINGGQGNWDKIPMTAHADISQADAELMARYILSLDGEKEH